MWRPNNGSTNSMCFSWIWNCIARNFVCFIWIFILFNHIDAIFYDHCVLNFFTTPPPPLNYYCLAGSKGVRIDLDSKLEKIVNFQKLWCWMPNYNTVSLFSTFFVVVIFPHFENSFSGCRISVPFRAHVLLFNKTRFK